MADILILHGPNLNLLGTREPQHYGQDRLEDIDQRLHNQAAASGLTAQSFQSNAEHELIAKVQQAASDNTAFIIINPAGFTHTSVALRDALAAVQIPFIEVHLSNVHGREPFRRHSYFSDIAAGVISGLGALGYELAIQAAIQHIGKNTQTQVKNNVDKSVTKKT
jgi:3-dehydroquinate dehydratase-2